MPQLQEMVELGGMKIKKIHATRFVELRSQKYTWLTLISLKGMGVNHRSCTSLSWRPVNKASVHETIIKTNRERGQNGGHLYRITQSTCFFGR